MDMPRTVGTAVRIASWLTVRVVSPTMTSSNGGGRSSERRGSSPQTKRRAERHHDQFADRDVSCLETVSRKAMSTNPNAKGLA